MTEISSIELLVGMLDTMKLQQDDFIGYASEPLANWLDSLARLELVNLIEAELGVDLEELLLGPAARELTLAGLSHIVSEARASSK